MCRKLIVKYFFLAGTLFLGVCLDLDKYIFPWQTFFVDFLRLRSCFGVYTVVGNVSVTTYQSFQCHSYNTQ